VKRVVVVGAGVSGLATALNLEDEAREKALPLDVVVLERGNRAGGNIRTERADGWHVEWGPNGFLDNVPATPALVSRIGLSDKVMKANPNAAKRFLFRKGKLQLLPAGPIGFVMSGVLSVRGRARVLLEPFGKPPPRGVDETVFDFARRRIGHEAASVLVDAMVSGVFAGNVRELSLKSSFPVMATMEADHGGLVKAMLARMKTRRAAKVRARELRGRGEAAEELTRPGGPAGPGGTLTSFESGLSQLVDALLSQLSNPVRFNSRVATLIPSGELGSLWHVVSDSGDTVSADAVVLAAPAAHVVDVTRDVDADLADALSRLNSAGLAVVAVGFDAASIGGAPDGFGFLVPRGEGIRILGCLWDSSIFPGRAPDGKVLMRAMIGGAHDPEAVALPDDELLRIVLGELRETMGLDANPVFTRVIRHRLGIGQYVTGHQACLDRIHAKLDGLPGLFVAGSSYYGISMNSCIQKAAEQAQGIVEFLAGDSESRLE
jgi:oxygen-dependent protoporphyrinogen oxidase